MSDTTTTQGQIALVTGASRGIGRAIAMALASVIIGVNAFGRLRFVKATTAVVLGSILYNTCVAVAIRAGVSRSSMS